MLCLVTRQTFAAWLQAELGAAALLDQYDALWADPPVRTNARLLEIIEKIELSGTSVTDVHFRDA